MDNLIKKLEVLEKNIKVLTNKMDELIKENLQLRERNRLLSEKEKNYLRIIQEYKNRAEERSFLLKKLERISNLIEKEINNL
jgi:tRNA threonylcarbamoyladenosine modification (KEOPS) complex Cgi121 subunit